MKRIVLATRNRGKTRELRELFADLPVEVMSVDEVGVDHEVEEDGDTFEANAMKKAVEIQAIVGGIVIADDSGLEVDALDGAPGVRSARYGGDGVDTDEARWRLLLRNLEGVGADRRTARFVCAAALAAGEKRLVVRGTVEGRIAFEPSGSDGFGYDPVFLVDGFEPPATMAQLPMAEKNRISHRGRAMRLLKQALQELLADGANGGD